MFKGKQFIISFMNNEKFYSHTNEIRFMDDNY